MQQEYDVDVCVCFQVGMKQHFELGQFLRSRYKGFLNESYDRREVNGLSSSLSDHMMPQLNPRRQTMIHINI